ncbi:V-type ATP synthase subunit A [Desulfogranum marinum]|uniref:V-type ATP synthase subunit A n=1 Tax=Desulfogranum marinum TaxID=453220 RepID=UPI0019628D8D|nr:V-type ATP synthase subunit A [Desulfogranum marinum]MBM9513788.1 V-type ATP synthase subunit A [Desulfogranum marinum]
MNNSPTATQLAPTESLPVVTMISGPVLKICPASALSMNELVEVGKERLLGEVISLDHDVATVQVFENTSGIRPGTKVQGLGLPLYVELGPGLIGTIFDGVQRPLQYLQHQWGDFIQRGKIGHPLDRERVWTFSPLLSAGDQVTAGSILGEVAESSIVTHRVLIPPGKEGKLELIVPAGKYTLDDVIANVKTPDGTIHGLKLFHRWPVRKTRPYAKRLIPAEPLITGQRVIDTFFPLVKGGTAAIPGGFGTGKTITQHQLTKWTDADIIVYIGCGERGNEMTGVLVDLPQLLDPRSQHPLIERTILIANTSDMPVAAREASIYTGITIAEYYRDMGYDVALMADSTSRWAEALREISGRLEEMPAEEGFPAYLASRLAAFYERAGQVETLSNKKGSVTLIGAVSPPGGDFSEPVTMHTKRFVQCFWALDKEMASARYFPAINYLQSYSGYSRKVEPWWSEQVASGWLELTEKAMQILQEDAKLQNTVKLLGEEALPDDQKRIIEGAKLLKNDFLQQSAFDAVDTYASPQKQFLLLDIILYFFDRLAEIVAVRIPLFRALELPVVVEIHRLKFTQKGDESAPFLAIRQQIDQEIETLLQQHHENSF